MGAATWRGSLGSALGCSLTSGSRARSWTVNPRTQKAVAGPVTNSTRPAVAPRRSSSTVCRFHAPPVAGTRAPGAPGERAYCPGLVATAAAHQPEEPHMSKGMDQKKEQKKKPAKTMKEKKAEKREKKATKGFAPV